MKYTPPRQKKYFDQTQSATRRTNPWPRYTKTISLFFGRTRMASCRRFWVYIARALSCREVFFAQKNATSIVARVPSSMIQQSSSGFFVGTQPQDCATASYRLPFPAHRAVDNVQHRAALGEPAMPGYGSRGGAPFFCTTEYIVQGA